MPDWPCGAGLSLSAKPRPGRRVLAAVRAGAVGRGPRCRARGQWATKPGDIAGLVADGARDGASTPGGCRTIMSGGGSPRFPLRAQGDSGGRASADGAVVGPASCEWAPPRHRRAASGSQGRFGLAASHDVQPLAGAESIRRPAAMGAARRRRRGAARAGEGPSGERREHAPVPIRWPRESPPAARRRRSGRRPAGSRGCTRSARSRCCGSPARGCRRPTPAARGAPAPWP